jgi:hypothetical protein
MTTDTSRSPWRTAGPWLALLIALMMGFNAWQAFIAPQAFATRFGTPGAADASAAFVTVYASRALFLGAITAVLLFTQQWRACKCRRLALKPRSGCGIW